MELEYIKAIMDVKEKIGGIAEIVNRHDIVTLPQITNTLLRMESKQNADIARFNLEKTLLEERILPLELDYKLRQEKQDNYKNDIGRFKWAILTALVIGAVMGFFDHIILIIKNIFK